MSEPVPEGGGAPAAGGFLTKKYMGIPAVVWLVGVVLLAYLYFRHASGGGVSGSGSTTSGAGQESTGDISVGASSPQVSITSQYTNRQPSSITQNPPRHSTKNPQPTPKPKKSKKVHQTKVNTGGTVTVDTWPGASQNGLAQWNTTLWGISQHTGVPLATLLKLNPQIKNPNLIFTGEKIRY